MNKAQLQQAFYNAMRELARRGHSSEGLMRFSEFVSRRHSETTTEDCCVQSKATRSRT
jgi:hypothetical protein